MNRSMMDVEHTSSSTLPFLSPCSSHLSSFLFVVYPLDIFSPRLFHSALLFPRLVTVRTKPNRGILFTKMWWNRASRPNLQEVSRPAEMSSPPNAGFPSAFDSGFEFPMGLYTASEPLQPANKNVWWLINTRQVLLNAGGGLKGANSFGRSPLFCSEQNGARPVRQLYCLN